MNKSELGTQTASGVPCQEPMVSRNYQMRRQAQQMCTGGSRVGRKPSAVQELQNTDWLG